MSSFDVNVLDRCRFWILYILNYILIKRKRVCVIVSLKVLLLCNFPQQYFLTEVRLGARIKMSEVRNKKLYMQPVFLFVILISFAAF